jgi:hypothetical protein
MPLAGPNKIIQGLWVGTELSVMEQLSIASFLASEHEYHLYVYNELKNVPAGTIVKDARDILPESMIFQYQGLPSYAGFANFFRYKLLLERGGWWADTDVVCLRPFDFAEEHVFSTEVAKGIAVVNTGVIKAPTGSRVMAYCWEVCQAKKPEELLWGETGPKLLGAAVKRFAQDDQAKLPQVFCPIGYDEWERVLYSTSRINLAEDTHSIHLWNEMWRRAGTDKNAEYTEGCFYEELKRRYLRPDELRQSSGNAAITSSITKAPAGSAAAANAVRVGSGVTPSPGSHAE